MGTGLQDYTTYVPLTEDIGYFLGAGFLLDFIISKCKRPYPTRASTRQKEVSLLHCLGLHRGRRLDGYYGLAEVAGVCKYEAVATAVKCAAHTVGNFVLKTKK